MHPDQKFQQRWEYRKKDDDADSSSDDTKSNSGDEQVQMKHKVILDLILPEKDGESDTPGYEPSNELNVLTATPLQILEPNNMQCGPGKKRISAENGSKGNARKKRKSKVKDSEEPAHLADLKTFTSSLLKELKAARHTMLVRMKRQITRLTSVKSAPRTKRKECKTDNAIHQKENESGMKTATRAKGSIERPKKKAETSGSSKRVKAVGKKRNTKQAPVANGVEKIENLSLPMKKPISDSDQTASVSHLALPGIRSKPQIEISRTEISLSEHIHAEQHGMNKTNLLEKESFLTDAQSYCSYLPSILPDEEFESFSRRSSKNVVFLDDQSMNPGLEAPLHQWPNNCFGVTSQIVLETPGEENNGAVCPRMDSGGLRFPGRSNALSESFVTNTVSWNMRK